MADNSFVVKNGLIVNTNILVVNTSSNSVGIKTSSPDATLSVNGTANVSSNLTVLGTVKFANAEIGSATINSTMFSATSNNATNFAGQPASYYANATNLTSGIVNNARLPAIATTITQVGTLTTLQVTGNVVSGNSTVNSTINATSFSGTSNNSTNFAGQPASYYANATNLTSGTINNARLPAIATTITQVGTLTTLQVNGDIDIGNSTVNSTINATSFSGTSNNSTNFAGQPASYYANATNLTSGTVAAVRLPQGNLTAIGGLQIVDSVTNTSITIPPTANNVKTAYDTALLANTRAASAQTAAISAYTNAVSIAANATNLTSGTINNARLPAIATTITQVGTLNGLNATANISLTNIISTTNATANVVSIPNSNVNIDAGVLFVDSINNRVGINNTSPDADFTITGAANVSGRLCVGGNTVLQGDLSVNGDFVVEGNLTYTGTTIANGDYKPFSSGFDLGNTANRWDLFGVDINVSNTITLGDFSVNTTSFKYGNTTVYNYANSSVFQGTGTLDWIGQINTPNRILIGNSTVNSTINATSFSGTSNNSTNFAGQPASYYANATNLTSGTINNARLPAIATTITQVGTLANLNVTANSTFGNVIVNGTINRNPVITLAGDLSGSVTLTNLQNGTLTATLIPGGIALGTDTVGNYVATITAGNGLSGSASTEGATPTLAVIAGTGVVSNSSGVHIGQPIENTANPLFNSLTIEGTSAYLKLRKFNSSFGGLIDFDEPTTNISKYRLTVDSANNFHLRDLSLGNILSVTSSNTTISGNVSINGGTTARKFNVNGDMYVNNGIYTGNTTVNTSILSGDISTTGNLTVLGTINRSPVITLGGDLTGSVTLANLASATLTATIAAGSVALGTDTVGSYVATITSGAGLTGSGTGETSTPTLSVVAGPTMISNTTGIHINSAASFTMNSIVTGNSTVNSTINATSFSGTSNNSTNFAGQPASYYANATNLTSGSIQAARLPQGNATVIGAVQVLDSVTNTSVLITASANSVKTSYDTALLANTRAASAQTAAISAYTNAVSIAANATNLTSGTVTAARLPQGNATVIGAVQVLDSIVNTSIIIASSANSVKTAYDTALLANTRAASAQTAAIAAYTNAIAIAATDATNKAATAYSNAIAISANATNLTSGVVPTSRLNIGTGANQLVVLDTSSRLPAVSAELLTNLPTNIGSIVKHNYHVNTTITSGNALIPNDNTIPQINEGSELLSISHTPASISNILLIEAFLVIDSSVDGVLSLCLFKDSISNSIYSVSEIGNESSPATTISMRHYIVAGSTAQINFTIRGGLSSGGTITLNGAGSLPILGSTVKSSISVTEIKA